LEAYVEKLTPFRKEFNEIRDEVLAINDPSLMRGLAIVYYNWANNTAATAVGKPIRQQNAIFDSAIERYQLSIKADPTLGMAYHNWGTSLLKQAELNNSKDLKLRNEALALFDKTLTLDSNMYEAWLNSARMLSEIANEEADKEKQIEIFNESIKRYRAAIEIYPRDSQPFSNLGWIYRRLGHLIGDQEHFTQSITSYEQALKIKPNLENMLDLSTVLAESAEANSENAEELLDKGIKLLQDAQQSYGNSSDLSYRLGNKYMFKGHYLDESENLSLAASCFKVALELDASNTRAMNNWSHNEIMQAVNAQEAEKKSQLLESAKARLEQAMTIDPTNKHAWFNLGLIEKLKSELVTGAEKDILLDAAIGFHLKAEGIKPGHSSLELARIFALKGDLDQAFKWLEIWLRGPKGNITELKEDEDFSTLKDDQRYQALIPLS
jgi:tetratricopeptide (TPR) repeat protein